MSERDIHLLAQPRHLPPHELRKSVKSLSYDAAPWRSWSESLRTLLVGVSSMVCLIAWVRHDLPGWAETTMLWASPIAFLGIICWVVGLLRREPRP